TAPLRGEVHVEQADLAALEPHIDATLPVVGLATMTVELDGNPAQPRLALSGRLTELHHDDDVLGDLLVEAHVADSRLHVESDLIRRGTHLLAALLELPLTIELDDLDAPRIEWDRQGQHLVNVTGRGLDGELLA